jgi:hypothetical protein
VSARAAFIITDTSTAAGFTIAATCALAWQWALARLLRGPQSELLQQCIIVLIAAIIHTQPVTRGKA